MRFSTVFTVLAASAMVFSGPLPKIAAKKSAADVQKVFVDLNNKSGDIIHQLGSCADDACSSQTIDQLSNAINDSNGAISSIPPNPSDDALADAVASVISNIATGLGSYKSNCGDNKCSGPIGVFSNVDASLSTCLKTASNVATGLIPPVASRIINSVPTLTNIGFKSTLQVLGKA